MAKKKLKDSSKGFWKEFKAFISRGSVLDMAVGVVVGGAFSAIVTALVNILLSLVTWAVPGGLKGLVTVLPAVNDAQAGMDPANGLIQKFASGELQGLAAKEAEALYGTSVVESNPNLIESVKTTILSKYTLHGGVYTYNLSAVIDWGTFINAIISFLIVAFTLFIIVKVVKKLQDQAKALQDKAREDYYTRHPEERPAAPVPGAPKPTTEELLGKILVEMQKQNGTVEEKKE